MMLTMITMMIRTDPERFDVEDKNQDALNLGTQLIICSDQKDEGLFGPYLSSSESFIIKMYHIV